MYHTHSLLTRLTTALLALAMICTQAPALAAAPAGPKTEPRHWRYLLYLYDYSESMDKLEDTTQAFLTHQIKLAELAGERVKIAVIFFGGDGVKVVGDHGMPSAVYGTLLGNLRKHWPKPQGGTPMDAALQEAVRIVTALPPRSDVSVVMFADGVPESGYLRPD